MTAPLQISLSGAFTNWLPWLLTTLAVAGFVFLAVILVRQYHMFRQFDRKHFFRHIKQIKLLYTLIDSMPDWIYVKDRKSRFILTNKHLAASHGIRSPDEMIGKTDFDYYPESLARTFFSDEQAIMKDGKPIVNKEEVLTGQKEGDVVLSTTKIPVRNKRDQVVGIVGIGRDITRQKHVEERLKQLSQVASSTENVVVIMDGSGNLEWVNRGFEEKYGCSLEEFVKKNGRNLRACSSNENIGEILNEIIVTGRSQSYSSRARDRFGNDVWYQSNITPVIDDQGKVSSLVLIDSDITGLKKADLQIKQQKYELEAQRDQLRKLNARKDKLFSIIAHDLKNPFQAIIGFSELLKSEYNRMDQERVREYMELIHDSSSSAYELLFNLLEWARAQTGAIRVSPGPVCIKELIPDIIDLNALHMKEKQVRSENLVDEKIVAFADRNMVHTILRNLTSNAIKYTPSGGKVTLDASEKNGSVEVSVSDTGVGISEEKIKTLFSLEKGKSTAGTAGETGTGLGLLVCEEFLSLNRGKIRVTSQPGRGSTFTITLPAAPSASSQ
ncbi:MAG TPA: PAS domain S-box protein [Bacteroides sp.]|nr:PAS domain S-box protein [Bacteroides sp.]